MQYVIYALRFLFWQKAGRIYFLGEPYYLKKDIKNHRMIFWCLFYVQIADCK